MKKLKAWIAAACAALTGLAALPSGAQSAPQILTGDTRLACEAVMCLSTSKQPNECRPSLERYFGISYRYPEDTIRARVNFLKLCPASNESPQMSALVVAIANGAGNCDAATLNTVLYTQGSWGDGGGDQPNYISNQLPQYCAIYLGNAYTNFTDTYPRYVGTPQSGGYWVPAWDYDRALAAWNAQQQQQPTIPPYQGGNGL